MNLLEQQFELPPDIVIKEGDGKYLFLSPSKPKWIVTNSNGAFALKLCNGKRTLGEIINAINKVANRDVSKEIQGYFQEIIANSNLFSSDAVDSFPPCKQSPYDSSGSNESM